MFEKKTIGSVLIVSLLTILAFSTTTFAGTGNGAPSGQHFNLNLIGLKQGGSASTTGNGGVIFVPLTGKCIIDLTPNTSNEFAVLDNNCVNGTHASFTLPTFISGPSGTSTTFTSGTTWTFAYSIWARFLGPKGSASIFTCFTDSTGATFCNTGGLVFMSSKEISDGKFTNVSQQLLTVCVGGSTQAIFAQSNLNYFWTYDNLGNHLAQFRFYQLPNTVITSTTGCTSTLTTTS